MFTPRLFTPAIILSCSLLSGCSDSGSDDAGTADVPDNTFDLKLVDSTDLAGFWLLTANLVSEEQASNEKLAVGVRYNIAIDEHINQTVTLSNDHNYCFSDFTALQNASTPLDISGNQLTLSDTQLNFYTFNINTTGNLQGTIYNIDGAFLGSAELHKLSNDPEVDFSSADIDFRGADGEGTNSSFNGRCFQELQVDVRDLDTSDLTLAVRAYYIANTEYQIRTFKIDNPQEPTLDNLSNTIASPDGNFFSNSEDPTEISTHTINSEKQSLNFQMQIYNAASNMPEGSLISIDANIDLDNLSEQ